MHEKVLISNLQSIKCACFSKLIVKSNGSVRFSDCRNM